MVPIPRAAQGDFTITIYIVSYVIYICNLLRFILRLILLKLVMADKGGFRQVTKGALYPVQ